MPHDGSLILSDLRLPTLTIVCEACAHWRAISGLGAERKCFARPEPFGFRPRQCENSKKALYLHAILSALRRTGGVQIEQVARPLLERPASRQRAGDPAIFATVGRRRLVWGRRAKR
jgi:hypothetical protein